LAIILEHYDSMLDHYGTPGIKIARKHLGWYSKGLPKSAEFRSSVMREENPDTVRTILREFYKPNIEKAAA
jgi:tRNA-dihydrouridine synthase B